MNDELKKWETIGSEHIGNFKVFDLYVKKRVNAKTNKASNFTSLEAPNWVNILAITKNQEIILVEQYRHGIDDFSLELPAGVMELDEDSRSAAERECIEETGYEGENEAILLGKVRANPAFLNNYCFHYLWENCELKYSQNLDENEDIRVILKPMSEVTKLIKEGKLQHTLTLSALMLYSIKIRQ